MNDVRRKFKPITQVEQVELFELHRNKGSQKAYDAIFNSVTKFVVDSALRYKNQGVELADLIQAGNLGVHIAIRRFDPAVDIKFMSYAVGWILAEIRRELAEQSRFVKVNRGDAQKQYQVNRATQKLEQELCRIPTLEEISKRTKINMDELEVMQTLKAQPSMDDTITEGFKLSDTIEDNKFLKPDKNVVSLDNYRWKTHCGGLYKLPVAA